MLGMKLNVTVMIDIVIDSGSHKHGHGIAVRSCN